VRATSGKLLVPLGLLSLLSAGCGASNIATPTPKPGLIWYRGEEMQFQYPKGWAVQEQERKYVALEPASGLAVLTVQGHLFGISEEPRPYEDWKEDLAVALYAKYLDYEGFEILQEYPLDGRPVFEYRYRNREEQPWTRVLRCFLDGGRLGTVTVAWVCYPGGDPGTFQRRLELRDKHFEDIVRSVSIP